MMWASVKRVFFIEISSVILLRKLYFHISLMTGGKPSELFTKSFGYYRKTNDVYDVYWPGLDFNALRTTFHTFLLNSNSVSDARRRRHMGHNPLDEGERSYAQGMSPSALLGDLDEVKIDISMIQSPFRQGAAKVISLQGTRLRQATG